MNCEVCKRPMTNEKGESFIGCAFNVPFENESFNQMYPEIKKQLYEICYVCWLKSLGIRL